MKISEHITIYSIQKESLFSILGRIGISLVVPLLPFFLIIDNFALTYFYMWFSILIIFYHILHFSDHLLHSEGSIYGTFLLLLWLVGGISFLLDEVLLLAIVIHTFVGHKSLLNDYLLSDLDEFRFFNFAELNEAILAIMFINSTVVFYMQ